MTCQCNAPANVAFNVCGVCLKPLYVGKMTDDKVKAREWWITPEFRGEASGILYPARVLRSDTPEIEYHKAVRVIEHSAYLALQSELEAVKQLAADRKRDADNNGDLLRQLRTELAAITKERDGLRAILDRDNDVTMEEE